MLPDFSGGLPAVPSASRNFAELLSIADRSVGGNVIQTIDARRLHGFLVVATAFKDWFPRRVAEYGLKEGVTFCSFLSERSGGRPSKEYALTLVAALQVGAGENNDQGREVLAYVSELLERKMPAPAFNPLDPHQMLAYIADYARSNIALQAGIVERDAKIEVLQPKADEFERFMAAGNAATAEDFFKRLASRGYDVGLHRGFKWLRAIGIVQQAPSVLPYQKHLDHEPKRFITHTVVKKYADGRTRNCEQMLITPDGRVWLAKRFEETYPLKK